MLRSADIVDHFVDVGKCVRLEEPGFGSQWVLQRALSAFNLAGEDSPLRTYIKTKRSELGRVRIAPSSRSKT